MLEKSRELLSDNPVIRTEFASAVEKILNQRLATEFQQLADRLPENITSPETALLAAKREISVIWQKEISPILHSLINTWEKSLLNNPKERYLKKLFQKPEELELKIEVMYFSELLELKNILPEVWETLVRISILRQQWEIELLGSWLKKLPKEEFTDDVVDKEMLELAVEIANQLGPLFAQTYLMQMTNDYRHLLPYKVKRKNNDSYSIYQVVDETTTEEKLFPLKRVFPDTVPQIVIRCRNLATLVLAKYPKEGLRFSIYLEKVADFLDSDNTDKDLDTTSWEEISTLETELEKSGWPILMVATHQPYITGEIKKIDFDFLIGLRTKKTKENQDKYSYFAALAKKIAIKYVEKADKTINPADISFLLYGIGTNNFWRNQGSADEQAVCYENSVFEVSRGTVLPFYQKLFKKEATNIEDFDELTVISTIVHELGHTVLSLYQQRFSDRLGEKEKHSEMIDEIKADTTGIRIFWESNPSPEQAKKMLEYIVAYYANYTESSQLENAKTLTGEFNTYQEMAGIVIRALLEVGSLVRIENNYEVVNVEAGFTAISKISDDFLTRYSDPEQTPADFEKLAKEIEIGNKNHQGFQEFIEFLTT